MKLRNTKHKKVRGAVLFMFFISLSISFCSAETIELKRGITVKGPIIEKTQSYIKVDYYGVALVYYYEDIVSIDGVNIIDDRDLKNAGAELDDSLRKDNILRKFKMAQSRNKRYRGHMRIDAKISFVSDISMEEIIDVDINNKIMYREKEIVSADLYFPAKEEWFTMLAEKLEDKLKTSEQRKKLMEISGESYDIFKKIIEPVKKLFKDGKTTAVYTEDTIYAQISGNRWLKLKDDVFLKGLWLKVNNSENIFPKVYSTWEESIHGMVEQITIFTDYFNSLNPEDIDNVDSDSFANEPCYTMHLKENQIKGVTSIFANLGVLEETKKTDFDPSKIKRASLKIFVNKNTYLIAGLKSSMIYSQKLGFEAPLSLKKDGFSIFMKGEGRYEYPEEDLVFSEKGKDIVVARNREEFYRMLREEFKNLP